MSKEDMYVIEGGSSEIEIPSEPIMDEIDETQLQTLYEEHQDAIDLMGGLDTFESLMSLPDEDFEQLKPAFIDLYNEVVNEKQVKQELLTLIEAENYTEARLDSEWNTLMEALDSIDFLSKAKIDFLKETTAISINKIRELIKTPQAIVTIPCELSAGATKPTYAHDTDAGMDIYSPKEYTIAPGETVIIPTGIKCAIPEGYAILIQPRSGQSAKTKLRIANTPGLIDAGYRDEIGVIIENIEPPFKDIDYELDENGKIHIKSILHGQSYTIAEGQRFAQMRLVQVPKAIFMEVESVNGIGKDRLGGFGSSGQ